VTRYLDREDRAEYVYTLFVPSDASSAFPCFDQPDLKARFKLELLMPRAWTAVSNAPVARVEDAGNSVRRIQFKETRPISTYLFAFAAGPFAEILASPGGTRLFVRKSQLARARQEAPEVLRLNREAVRWFERYFDSRFPFPKYDLVLIPELAYGGMEHAGRLSCARTRYCFLLRRTRPTSSRARRSSFTKPRTSGSAIRSR